MITVEDLHVALTENFEGEPWHGQALRTILDGIGEGAAHARPISGGHTIAELLGHIVAWTVIVGRRVRGEVFEVMPEDDFPEVASVPWPDLVARLEDAQRQLLKMLTALKDSDLTRTVPGKGYAIGWMLQGLVYHNTYHAAQIALLKKAAPNA